MKSQPCKLPFVFCALEAGVGGMLLAMQEATAGKQKSFLKPREIYV